MADGKRGEMSRGVIGFVLGVALASVIYVARGTGPVEPAVITPVLSGFFGGILGAVASLSGTFFTLRAQSERARRSSFCADLASNAPRRARARDH
jgi:hypothetical protein